MRASRLLRILLALQNRGRLTTLQLSQELEVAQRTIMRDIDALAEAGLPIVVHRGNRGGVELGFNYRSRLVGLSAAEAEALGVLLTTWNPALTQLAMLSAAKSACDKLVEAMPEVSRQRIHQAQRRFRCLGAAARATDERIAAFAAAIRESKQVRIQSNSRSSELIHPIGLQFGPTGWAVIDARNPNVPINDDAVGDINISALRF